MGGVVELTPAGKYAVEYIHNDGVVVGVSHPDWPFRIMRKDSQVAIVCEDTDEPFGILDRDVFNTILLCWLLIDDPDLIDEASVDK